MNVEDLLDRLEVMGLDEDEARAYLHLSRAGAAKAADVAVALRSGRTEAYRTLTSLVQRGFAVMRVGRPALYEARPIELVFADIEAAERARVDNILRLRADLAAALAALRRPDAAAPHARQPVRMLQGRREIYRTLERMLSGASSDVAIVSTHEASLTLAEAAGTFDVAMRRAEAGARLRVVLREDAPTRERLPRVARAPAEFRVARGGAPLARFVVVDSRELLLWVASDPSPRLNAGDDVALWSGGQDLVATMAWLFECAWAASVPAVPAAAREEAPARRVPLRDAEPR